MQFKEFYEQRAIIHERNLLRNATAALTMGLGSMGATAQTPEVQFSIKNAPGYIAHITPKLAKIFSENDPKVVLGASIKTVNDSIKKTEATLSGQESDNLRNMRKEYANAQRIGSESEINYIKKKIRELETTKNQAIEQAEYSLNDFKILLNALQNVKTANDLNAILQNPKSLKNYIGLGYIDPTVLNNNITITTADAYSEIGK